MKETDLTNALPFLFEVILLWLNLFLQLVHLDVRNKLQLLQLHVLLLHIGDGLIL